MSNIHKIVDNGLVLRDEVIIVQLWKIWQGEFFNCLSQLFLVSGMDIGLTIRETELAL